MIEGLADDGHTTPGRVGPSPTALGVVASVGEALLESENRIMNLADVIAFLFVPVRLAWGATVLVIAGIGALCAFLCRGPSIGARFVDHFVRGVGGSPIKLCQWLSTRQDMIGPVWAEAFRRLLDHVQPPPRWLMRMQIRHHAKKLGLEVKHITMPALGCGSVACALKVELASGERVVFKITRVGYRFVARMDRILYLTLGWIAHPFAPYLNLPQQLGRFARRVLEQGDMLVERANLEALAIAVAKHPGIKVPRVIGATKNACVMELVADAHPLGSAGDADRPAGIAVVRSLLGQVFAEDVLHCDAHPANVLVVPDGTAYFIDGGLAERLTAGEKERLAMGVGGLLSLDHRRLGDSIIAASPKPPNMDEARRAAFDTALEGFAKRAADAIKNPDFRLTRLVIELFDILRTYRVGADPNLVMANTALAIAESYTSLAKLDVRVEVFAAMQRR